MIHLTPPKRHGVKNLKDKIDLIIMNLKQARILLKKINSLFDSIDYEESSVSNIERDLMMNYLQQLNELFKYDQENNTTKSMPTGNPESRSLSDQTTTRYDEPPIKRAPAPKPEPESKPINKRLITDYPPPRSKEEPTPPPPPKVVKTKAFSQDYASSEVEQLFEVKQASDLSEKLSESPINDLSRALSINDRLLYMNELFGRNMETLNQALQELNAAGSMTQAKPYLINLAEKYTWINDDRIEIAKSFIKLIRRRYQ